ncbi:hypothetical protein [Streptomyces sp. NPDC056821]|uniref:hypothetical protein n=1 Tax=unclassified Streptomyces TaxID=2593676 RepID=UPI0036A5CD3A
MESWLRTGDDGYFSTVDRKKDLIIRDGFDVHPQEIEAVLYEHPSVTEELRVSVRDPVARRTNTRARPGSSTPSRRGPPARSSRGGSPFPRRPDTLCTPPRREGSVGRECLSSPEFQGHDAVRRADVN